MSDLISRQAAIDAIDAVFPVDPMKSEYAQGIACGAALAKTYVEQLPSAQRWIPCSERLPKYNTPVLLALNQIGKERTIVIGERRTRKSGWYFVDIAAYDPEHKVIAWMPLPEPYKAESEE
jgi:hypothetical protein